MRKKDNARMEALRARGEKVLALTRTKWGAFMALPFLIPAGILGGLLALLLVIVLGGAFSSNNEPPAATAVASKNNCPVEFRQTELDRSKGNKVDPRYAEKIQPLIDQLNAEKITKADFKNKVTKVELELAGTSAQTLAVSAFGAGLIKDANQWEGLVTDGCLNQEGQRLLFKYSGALEAKGVSIEPDKANPDAINSGIQGKTFGQDANRGIYGNLTTIRIKFANGSVAEFLVRCKNLTFLRWIKVPKITTDNPTPPRHRPPGEFKDWSKNVPKPQGVTRLGPGRLTDGHESSDQKEDGQTSGNVIDHKVPSGTKSGDTTSDTGDSVKAPGAHEGGDDSDDAVSDDSVTTDDDGGTDGATEISEPSDE